MIDKKKLGALTGVRLDDVRPLLRPWQLGPFGQLMPPIDSHAAQLSEELAATAYTMDVSTWLAAGWRDVTVQMENRLQEGIDRPQEDQSPRHRLTEAIKRTIIQREGTRRDPLSGMAGTLRQLNRESDTCKALVMIHPTLDGRFVVAIGFMGTGNVQDWIANLRMNLEEETHQGFLQLTRQFEGNEDEIHFPETARELGLDRLTLADVLEEARMPDSRFVLWIAGHSQGGALTQLYLHRKLHLNGVYPQNLIGYGFGSPRTVTGRFTPIPSAYPLYLIENSEDLIPRSGALVHLGVRLIYPADDELRTSSYGWPRDEISERNRKLVRPIMAGMTDMPRILEGIEAYLKVLENLPVEETMEGLALLPLFRTPVKKLALAADSGFDAMLHRLSVKVHAAYEELAGESMDAERVQQIAAAIQRVASLIGMRAFTAAMKQLMKTPHAIGAKPGAPEAVYAHITRQDMRCLTAMAWTGGDKPMTIRADRFATTALATPIVSTLTVARRKGTRPNRTIRRPRGGHVPPHRASRRQNRNATTEDL